MREKTLRTRAGELHRRGALQALTGLTVGALLTPLMSGAAETVPAEPFKLKHLYTGDDGLSHFEDLVLKPGDHGTDALFTRPARHATIRAHSPGKAFSWHNSGGSRLIFYIAGEAEMELSDGSKLTFKPGMILLAEDRTGKGHTGRILGPTPSFNVDIELGEA